MSEVENTNVTNVTNVTNETNVTSVKEMDYLDEDKPIRGQNYVLLSFLSPEDVLVNKEAYMFNQFITKFSNDMTTLLDGIQSKYSDSKDFVDSIKENNSYIFNPSSTLAIKNALESAMSLSLREFSIASKQSEILGKKNNYKNSLNKFKKIISKCLEKK